MTEGQLPSKDPANDLNLAGMLQATFAKLMQSVNTMLPARVVAYDRTTNTASVQPLIAVLTTSGATVSRAPIARVPCLALGGGGFVINFPLREGDLGWIEASDRDISIYLQSFRESRPATVRLHDFADSRFIPDAMSKFDASAVADDAMTVQTTDGAVRVTISPSKVEVVAPALMLKASTIEVRGVSTFTDRANFNNDIVVNGIQFGTHRHTGVSSGSATSGGPTS